MKTYRKAKMVAKNAPVGSYTAGCPEHHGNDAHGCNGVCEIRH